MVMSMIKNCSHKFSNGVVVVNTTPHPITFREGDQDVTIPTSVPAGERTGDLVINAKSQEIQSGPFRVRTKFNPEPKGYNIIEAIECEFYEEYTNDMLMIVGSMIAAQAYPGRVVVMCPAPGFERVPPAEKRMDPSRFTTF